MAQGHHMLRNPGAAQRRDLPAQVDSDSGAAALQVRLEFAGAVAGAGDALPSAYRGKPGAVLLAMGWSEQRGVDLLTTLQAVSFVDGRPVVDATMLRALAVRAGYGVKVTEPDRTTERDTWQATVTISKAGAELGGATYTWADATEAQLVNKRNWQRAPVDMLVARATSRAMRWHAPDVMAGVVTEDDLEAGLEQPDITDVAAPTEPDDPVVDAELVDDEPQPDPVEPAQEAQEAPSELGDVELEVQHGTLEALLEARQALDATKRKRLERWATAQQIALGLGMTDDEARRVLERALSL